MYFGVKDTASHLDNVYPHNAWSLLICLYMKTQKADKKVLTIFYLVNWIGCSLLLSVRFLAGDEDCSVFEMKLLSGCRIPQLVNSSIRRGWISLFLPKSRYIRQRMECIRYILLWRLYCCVRAHIRTLWQGCVTSTGSIFVIKPGTTVYAAYVCICGICLHMRHMYAYAKNA